jgi:DMSO/TMAO reductase YedYZ molybdopterin-dependent catalytic subunit
LPVSKALDDVLLAYEMNDAPLTADHGAPLRLVVPGWVGIASIKWVGTIEVSTEPLRSPWNTEFYRMFGPDYPQDGGAPLTRQTVKSVFELARGATLALGERHRLYGRSWSAGAAIEWVEVSWDDGRNWRRARLLDEPGRAVWTRWSIDWQPRYPGNRTLLARAGDLEGNTQPRVTPVNREGYLFDAMVRHPVTIV